jgi:hypothetical protein
MATLALRVPPRRIANPRTDPRFVAVTQQIKTGAAQLKKHVPAARKAQEASRSARAPANERMAGAKVKVVDSLKQAPTPRPQPNSFKALLRAEIDKAMPKTLGDTEKFMGGGQANAMKGSLGGNVDAQKASATGPVAQASKKSPDPGSVPAQATTTLPAEPTPPRPAVAAGDGMPPPATAAEVSLQQSKQDTAQALKDDKVKPESLAKANDPRFSAVAGAQAQVASQADRAPASFRARETAVLAGARAQAGGVAARGTLLLAGTRGRGNAQVLSRQRQQAAKEEAERQKVAANIEAIFTRTKARVEARLERLDSEVSALFDRGVDAALATMKAFVDDRIFKYKLERYLTIPGIGLARWLRDQALGLPEEVNAFYAQGRKVFQAAMDRLIDRVANLVESRLAQAKAEVESGQAQIKAYVAGLPANLRATGDAAAKAVSDRFTELAQSIDAKQEELASSLAQKYKEAFDKADEALKTMQDENKGLLQKFAEKLGEIVKALQEFKAKLMGLIRKGQEAIQLILDDPVGFLGKLLSAVKGGFNAFVANIWTHLKAGFIKWLFGSLAGMGITLPTDLSLPSILKLVLDVLGITYDKMRAKAVRILGERAVGLIEKACEYIKELVTGGPAKLWEKVKEDLGNLKEMVIDAIQDWLITTIIKQAVAKVVSMFNPVGAIVQAILAIYNVVMFVIEKAQQIMSLVEAVVNSVYDIATGAIGSAIAWIERALANAVPLVIGLLARLLGLGGITQKIQEFIKKVQRKVDAAIDKAIAKVVAVVRKLFGAAKAGVQKLLNWWKKKLPIAAGGESHSLTFAGEKKAARLVIRSDPAKPSVFVASFGNKKKIEAAKVEKGKQKTEALEKPIYDMQKKLAPFDDEKSKKHQLATSSSEPDQLMKTLDTAMASLQGHVVSTLKEWGAAEEPLPTQGAVNLRGQSIAIEINRPKRFSAAQKDEIVEHHKVIMGRTRDKAEQKDMATMYALDSKKRKERNVRADIARRHVVSSDDMAKHYEKVLRSPTDTKPLFPSAAKLLIEQRTSIADARVSVKGNPPKKSDIQQAAADRHKKFFGYAKNIFLGNTEVNSKLQQYLDTDHPELVGKKLQDHIRLIKRAWALDDSFVESRK